MEICTLSSLVSKNKTEMYDEPSLTTEMFFFFLAKKRDVFFSWPDVVTSFHDILLVVVRSMCQRKSDM